MAADLPEQTCADVDAWRAWLAEHHGSPTGVWLVLAKKGTTQPTSLSYDQALDEALCHGWIDGQSRRRDETTYLQRFTPRRARSPWSARNVGIVGRLVTEGCAIMGCAPPRWSYPVAVGPGAICTPTGTRCALSSTRARSQPRWSGIPTVAW